MRGFIAAGAASIMIALFFSGCLFAPVIEEIRGYGLGSSDRQSRLGQDAQTFLDAMHWRRAGVALGMATEEFREELKGHFRARGQDERVVESRVDFIDFNDESNQAEVEVVIRYYKVPFYVVEERREIHDWLFALSSGWKIRDIRITE